MTTTTEAPPGLVLAPQQQAAVEKINTWYDDWQDNGRRQVFRLFGYAGSGKTTLAQHIVRGLAERGADDVRYAAYTGKAAYVLRTKGCEDASTVHSLIYQPVEKVRAKLQALKRTLAETTDPTERDVLQRQIDAEEERLTMPAFIRREGSELSDADLLVLDEVSMINAPTAADLLSFGCPVLCLGDPAQLPPVEGGGYFIDAEPDHLLTEVHRSALDSPVTRLATTIRNAPVGATQYGVDGPDGDSGRHERISVLDLLSYDQVLVGTNKTRWAAIHLVRALTGLTSPLPQRGDKVIILANSNEAGVFNGQQFVATADARVDPTRPDRLQLAVVGDDDTERTLTAWASGFAGVEGEKTAKRDGRGTVVAATFGQAITVHKSQGSQWPNVLVIDEASVFARGARRDAARDGVPAGETVASVAHRAGQRWIYTAVTRAAERAVLVPGITGLLTGGAR